MFFNFLIKIIFSLSKDIRALILIVSRTTLRHRLAGHTNRRGIAAKMGTFNGFSWSSPPARYCMRNGQSSTYVAWNYPVQTISENWVFNYVKRHSELSTRSSRRYSYERANFDETGFAMSLTVTAKVVTRSQYYGRRSVLQLGNREWATAIEAISASGWALPPCIILKGKVFIQSWSDNLPDNWRIEISPNGWTSDEIGIR
ncbi:DDE-domain-containing protein [Aspergillus ruber CBS 135680]|uniref:DDE-domain-containing protein n=1 Tax=Aspergillus ruber (strain CBS 135680) TaxID=1388766 RepID=A0A017SG28_ASPRC|nr:DDE-domain-containing protein [Aspergillus ruber CBS 135680]EYE95564.1 DDE-domain-containing protein [Aspergillus ruber CBS 135680]